MHSNLIINLHCFDWRCCSALFPNGMRMGIALLCLVCFFNTAVCCFIFIPDKEKTKRNRRHQWQRRRTMTSKELAVSVEIANHFIVIRVLPYKNAYSYSGFPILSLTFFASSTIIHPSLFAKSFFCRVLRTLIRRDPVGNRCSYTLSYWLPQRRAANRRNAICNISVSTSIPHM